MEDDDDGDGFDDGHAEINLMDMLDLLAELDHDDQTWNVSLDLIDDEPDEIDTRCDVCGGLDILLYIEIPVYRYIHVYNIYNVYIIIYVYRYLYITVVIKNKIKLNCNKKKGTDDGELLLLCELCNTGSSHTYCCTPPLGKGCFFVCFLLLRISNTRLSVGLHWCTLQSYLFQVCFIQRNFFY